MNPRIVRYAIAVGLAFAPCAALAEDKAESPALVAGDYQFTVNAPEVRKDMPEITRDASVKVEARNITVDMTGTFGNEVSMRGIQHEGKIKVLVSDVDTDRVTTLHLIGTIKSDSQAEGKIVFIEDGKIATEGTWRLKKK